MIRRDPTCRAVVACWRRLSGGQGVRDGARRTLVACSGGADSCALAIMLASAARGAVVLGHVVHDLRPEDESLADRDAARALSERLGVPFLEASVRPGRSRGNAESNARRLRYAALARLAAEAGCGFVATAHHADDAAETLLMRLVRGAGPAGLGGLVERRTLAGGVHVIRPMLGVGRADSERVCSLAGWEWCEDRTNRDVTRLRSAVRFRVMPILRELVPGASGRLARTSSLLRESAAMLRAQGVDRLAAAHTADGFVLERESLRGAGGAVIGEVIREAARRLGGGRGLDALGRRGIDPVVRAIVDAERRPRRFRLGGIEVEVRSRVVALRRAAADGEGGEPRAGEGEEQRDRPDQG